MAITNVKQLRDVQKTHEIIMDAINSYALLAAGWVPPKEDDYDRFSNCIMNALLKDAQ